MNQASTGTGTGTGTGTAIGATDDDHLDIFADLDTDLIEIFSRGQQGQFFRGIPLEQHNQRLDNLNDYLIARAENRQYLRLRERELELLQELQLHQRGLGYGFQYIYFIWLFGILPIPALHYKQLWRKYRPHNIRALLMKFVARTLMILVRVIRFSSFVLASSAYLHGIIRNLFIFSNYITFSENFMRDVLTYVLHDSTLMLDRHFEVMKHQGDIFYFTDDPNYNKFSMFEIIGKLIINWISRSIQTSCVKTTVDWECTVMDQSLIFKFSDVLISFFPSLQPRSFSLKSATVGIFVLYALIGDIICVNILVFSFYNIGTRVLGYKSVMGNIGSIIYNTLFSELC
ncbi:hypothetical protein DFJ63DRAFT_314191 [Scheffersomyces coipomensis]|uniref:uncharacterized protein n=1 Tax=Scheffersomyces coipomensis TaxID=1788519 RepID=UPI00315D6402